MMAPLLLRCTGTEQQLEEAGQRSADQAEELTAAQTELQQLSDTHHRLQEQLQVKVIDLQQTQDSLEERTRQHRQLQSDHNERSTWLSQLRAELQGSTEVSAELQSQLAAKTGIISGIYFHFSRVCNDVLFRP